MRYTLILSIALCPTLSSNMLQAQSAATVSLSAGLIIRGMSPAKTGHLIEVSASDGFTKDLVYSLALGYHQWESASGTTEEELVDIPIHGGVRWEIVNDKITPYVSCEVGLHFLKRVVAWTSTVIPPPSWATTPEGKRRERQENTGRIGVRVGTGAGFELLQSMQLDVGARFVYVQYGFVEMGEQPETTAAIRHVDAVLSIRYLF